MISTHDLILVMTLLPLEFPDHAQDDCLAAAHVSELGIRWSRTLRA